MTWRRYHHSHPTLLLSHSHLCTATKFPFMYSQKMNFSRPPQSPFPHSCVCERFIYPQDRSAYFPATEQADRSWDYINRLQTHECGNRDGGRAIHFLGIFVSNFRYCVFAVFYSHPSVSYPFLFSAIQLSCLLYSHPSLLLTVHIAIHLFVSHQFLLSKRLTVSQTIFNEIYNWKDTKIKKSIVKRCLRQQTATSEDHSISGKKVRMDIREEQKLGQERIYGPASVS